MLDYDLDDTIDADTAERIRAVTDPVRSQILDLVLERAATITELAAALDRPKSTVAHHVGVLVDCGLLKVVRTRRVRAIEERYYGRTARRIVIGGRGFADGVQPPNLLAEALTDVATADPSSVHATLRYARIPASVATEFFERVARLADEFSALDRGGDTVHGVVAAVFPTSRPTLIDRGRMSQ